MFSRFEDKKLRNSRLFLVVFPKIRDREKRMIYTRLESSWIRSTFSRSAGASTAAVKINRRGLRSKHGIDARAPAQKIIRSLLLRTREIETKLSALVNDRSGLAASTRYEVGRWSRELIVRVSIRRISYTWHFHVINKSNLLCLIFDVPIHNLY